MLVRLAQIGDDVTKVWSFITDILQAFRHEFIKVIWALWWPIIMKGYRSGNQYPTGGAIVGCCMEDKSTGGCKLGVCSL